MTNTPSHGVAPSALRASRLGAPPAAAWPLVNHSRFIADYLGAELPDEALQAGRRLQGRDRAGASLTLTVTDAQPPCSLSLRLQSGGRSERLHLSLAACDGGCRLTVLHEPLLEPAGSAGAGPDDAVAALLAAPLPALLRAPAVGDAAALAAARRYLEDSAQAVRALLQAMAPRAGYHKPAPDRFSLVEHLWHLADVEQFGWAQRLPRVLAEHEPVLAGVDGDRLALERRYQQRPWRGAARRFVAQRQRSLRALARFDGAALQRPVQFGGRALSAGELLAAMLAHDHEHRQEMAALWPTQGATARRHDDGVKP